MALRFQMLKWSLSRFLFHTHMTFQTLDMLLNAEISTAPKKQDSVQGMPGSYQKRMPFGQRQRKRQP